MMRTQRHRRHFAVLGAAVIALTTATGCGAVHSATSKVKEATGGAGAHPTTSDATAAVRGDERCEKSLSAQANAKVHRGRHVDATDDAIAFAENAMFAKVNYAFCVLSRLDRSGAELRHVLIPADYRVITYTNNNSLPARKVGEYSGVQPFVNHPVASVDYPEVSVSVDPFNPAIVATFTKKVSGDEYKGFEVLIKPGQSFDFNSFRRVAEQVSQRSNLEAMSTETFVTKTTADAHGGGDSTEETGGIILRSAGVSDSPFDIIRSNGKNTGSKHFSDDELMQAVEDFNTQSTRLIKSVGSQAKLHAE
jgi:hypothetical protein